MPGLFERGARPPGSSRGKRKGLGLYIVRRVMDLHGGKVELVRNGPDGVTMRLSIAQSLADD
jgi:signal transduction histidine kinase